MLGPPKSDAAYRVVAMPQTVADLLRTHLAEFTGAAPSALVFTSVQGSPLLNRYFAPFGDAPSEQLVSTGPYVSRGSEWPELAIDPRCAASAAGIATDVETYAGE